MGRVIVRGFRVERRTVRGNNFSNCGVGVHECRERELWIKILGMLVSGVPPGLTFIRGHLFPRFGLRHGIALWGMDFLEIKQQLTYLYRNKQPLRVSVN